MSTNNAYFSEADIRDILKLKGHRLLKVTYYIWVNRVKEADSLSLEWLELESDNNAKVVLGSAEDSGGMNVAHEFSLAVQREKIKSEFGNTMSLEAVDMTISEEWDSSLPLLDIRFMSDSEGHSFLNNCLFFDFGDHQVELSASGEGLYVGLVGEDEEKEHRE